MTEVEELKQEVEDLKEIINALKDEKAKHENRIAKLVGENEALKAMQDTERRKAAEK